MEAAPPPLSPLDDDEYFAPQPTSTERLPDPRPLLENLARTVVEVLAGVREVEQISRWLSRGVYTHLLRRSVLAARARSARRVPVARPEYRLGGMRVTSPKDGVVEAVVVLHGRVRSRAVAIRLEGLDRRWRATAIHIL